MAAATDGKGKEKEAGADDRHITDADRACPNLESNRDANLNKELKPLAEGEVVGSVWKVIRAIEADRGFNIIHVVEHTKKKTMGALKIEAKNSKIPLLKFELFILLQMEQKQKTKQFCKVFDRGATLEYNYMVVTLCGKSIKRLRKETEFGRFSLACGLSVGMQCLKAIEEVHKLGFIHRSIAPSEFAIGRIIGDDIKELRNVYILDFGFGHQYKNADGSHKPPRKDPFKYMGSLRHAPRNAYLGRELSRLDDLEMWFYMLVEMVKGRLPWVHQREPKDVFEFQKAVRNGLPMRMFLGGLPVEFVEIMKEVDKLGYSDEPNYTEIHGFIGNAILMTGKKEFPYDWEEAEIAAAKEPKEEKKEGEAAAAK